MYEHFLNFLLEIEVFMLESKFQGRLIKRIEKIFPGCIILKNDPEYRQGIPDLTILYGKHWALIECKKSENEEHQPNQDYYILHADEMSFGRFIYPENEEEVINELQQAFQS